MVIRNELSPGGFFREIKLNGSESIFFLPIFYFHNISLHGIHVRQQWKPFSFLLMKNDNDFEKESESKRPRTKGRAGKGYEDNEWKVIYWFWKNKIEM